MKRMMTFVLVGNLFGTLTIAAAQTPQASDSRVENPAIAEREKKAEPNSPEDLLQQAYYLGGQLPVDERAYQMGELVIVAAKMRHPMLRQWVQEVFQLTANLPQQSQRQSTEQGALSALAEIDPAEALQMLGRMSPATLTKNAQDQALDNRINAARQIFPKYWKDVKEPDLDAVRSVANYLAETGQYPFRAAGLILKDVRERDAAGAESLFLDAMQYYQREQLNTYQFQIEFRALLDAAKDVMPDAMERAALELAVDRLMIQAGEPLDENLLYVGRTYTGDTFIEPQSLAEDILFRLLPLVRQFEPELEERITKKFPNLTTPQPSDLGEVPERISYAAIMVLDPNDPGARARSTAEINNNVRADTARKFAATDPAAALRLANSITDPAIKAATLMDIAGDKSKQSAPHVEAPAPENAKDAAQPQDEKTQLALLLARARAAKNDDVELWNTLNRALDLAEEMFQKEKKAAPLRVGYWYKPDWEGPGYMAAGFDEANTLIKLGMQKQRVNTLGWLAKEHDPALKSYMLISAAGPATAQKSQPTTNQQNVTERATQ